MAAAVTLSCALLLADADDRRAATAGGVFCVSAEPSRLVGELKEAVKRKKPRDLRHVDADALLLFLAVQQREDGVNWLSDEHDAALTLEIRGSALHEAVFEMLERPNAALRTTKPLSRYLSAEGLSPPGPEQIHLLVVAPPAPLGKRSAAAEPEGDGEIAGKRQMRSRFQGDMDDFADIVDVLDSDAEGTEDYHVPPPARRFEQTPTNQQSSSPMTRLLRDSPSIRDPPAPRPKLELPTNTTANRLVQPGSVLDSNLFGEHLRRRERDRKRERQLGQVSTRQAANSNGSSSLSAFAAKLNQARELMQCRELRSQHTPLRQESGFAGSSADRPIELLDPEPHQQPQLKTEFAAASAIHSSHSASTLKTERSPPTLSMASNPPAVAGHGPFELSRPERDWIAGAAAHPSISTEEMFARLTQYDTEPSAETSGSGSFEPSGLISPRDAQDPPADPELVFSDEQSEFIRLAVEERRNLLLVAPAGYGKSAVINRIMSLLKNSLTSINDQPVCGLCAPTGKAASLIKGRTLHSYLGIGLGRGSVSDWVKRVRSASFLKPTLKALRAVQVILIDEISMVSAQMLDRISQYLQEIRMNKKPFGGVQMILVGDLCQLPPVEGAFMFRSLEYARAKFHAFQFTKCFRQNDPVFVSLLNEVRFARCTEPTLAALRKCTSIAPEYANGLRPMIIVSTNKEVDTINERELNALIHERQAEVMTYNVRVSQFANPKKADVYRRADGIPEFVKLSVGCQVVVTQNIGNGIVNGTQGCVTSASSSKIELRLQDNNTATIEYFPYKDPEESDVFLARTLFSYMPVRLGYASTVHKAQGMTLQLLEVDVKRVFAHGQLYTALSRVTDLRGLIVKNLFPGSFICSEAVREFYKDLGKGGDTRETTTPVITEDIFVTAS